MITLQKEFKSGAGGIAGMRYVQLFRTDKVAMYKRIYPITNKTEYEVFFIKIRPKGTNIFNVITTDDEEIYPSISSFGKIAWCLNDYHRALVKYKKLCLQTDIPLDDEGNEIETPKIKSFVIPNNDFSTHDLADFNNIEYSKAALFLKECIFTNKVKFLREERRNGGLRPTKIYSKVT